MQPTVPGTVTEDFIAGIYFIYFYLLCKAVVFIFLGGEQPRVPLAVFSLIAERDIFGAIKTVSFTVSPLTVK